MTQSTPPGWYPDGQGGQRWWDGNQWTEHTLPAPEASDRPAPPAQPEQPGPGPADVTQVRPPEQPAGDRPAPDAGQPPAAAPTQVAGQHAQPQQPLQPQQGGYPAAPQAAGYGQSGQPSQQGQSGQPGQPAWQGQHHPSGGSGSGSGFSPKLLALVGGGAALVILLIVLAVVVLGGGGGPKSVVEDFIDADSCGDIEDLVTDDFLGGECDDDEVGTFPGGDEADVDHEVGDEEIDGDKATVDVTTKIEFDGQEEEYDTTFRLVKDDGDWKIDGIE